MLKKCVVSGCGKTSENSPSTIFVSFPTTGPRRNAWLEALNLKKSTAKHKVCEDHFNLSEDALNWSFFSWKRNHPDGQEPPRLQLKPEIVPRFGVPSSSGTTENDPPTKKIKMDFQVEVIAKGVQVKPSMCNKILQANVKPKIRSQCTQTQPISSDKAVQYDGSKFKTVFTLHSSSGSHPSTSSKVDSLWQSFASTSLSSDDDEDLKKDDRHLDRILTINKIERNSRFYLGIPKNMYSMINLLSQTSKLDYVDVLITLKKIRLNDSYQRISDDFALSISTVSRKFLNAVPKLATIMQNFIFSPTADTVKRMLPVPFRYRYNDVYTIIDCFEIEIEKPQNPLKQSLTWSDYKKCNTLKFIIGATPNGFISFISGAYGGRISDNTIVEESGFLDTLPNNVSVMADRGFKYMDTLLVRKNCKLIRPPSVQSGTKPSKAEVRLAKRIAALRIHIERVIRRLREFEMLHMHAVINFNHPRLMNMIPVIACAVVNIQEPILN